MVSRENAIDRDGSHRIAWHVRNDRIHRVLHNCQPSGTLDFHHAGAAVVEGAGEQHADDVFSKFACRGKKQRIDGGTKTIFFRSANEPDLVRGQGEMEVGWRQYDGARFNGFPVDRIPDGERGKFTQFPRQLVRLGDVQDDKDAHLRVRSQSSQDFGQRFKASCRSADHNDIASHVMQHTVRVAG